MSINVRNGHLESLDAVCSTCEHQKDWQTFFCSLLWPTHLKISYWFLGKKYIMLHKESGTCQSTTKMAICEPFHAVCSTCEHQKDWQTFFCSLLWPMHLKLSYWFLGEKKSIIFPKKSQEPVNQQQKWPFVSHSMPCAAPASTKRTGKLSFAHCYDQHI